ncbi:hypothetical protein DH2020_021180 [Rehmannia glutinosa]|uniref:ATP-dependent DNA ligase family profile domain-containing protein n=1 Tax=Rehmannia glutinosa TaxID=99300 RepID=A0ABR0WE13_REHGL
MSTSRRSAFDVLMSNASKKKKNESQAQSPKPKEASPRKRKAPVEISQTPNSDSNDVISRSPVSDPIENSAGNCQENIKNSISDQNLDAKVDNLLNNNADGTLSSKQTGSNNADSNEGVVVKKKPRVSISPDDSLVEVKKKAANFNVKKAVYWGEGERVPFMFVVKAFDAISKESGRIAITEIVCNMLRTVIETTPDDLLPVVYLLANRIAPAHEGLELGIEMLRLSRLLQRLVGLKKHILKSNTSFSWVMSELSQESGKDSQEKKKNHIKALLVAATDCEPQYLIRLLQTKLRIGLAEQTLLVALGHAAVYSEKHSSPPAKVDNPFEEAAKIVKQVYSVIPVYDKIVPALLSGGVWNLPKTCGFAPGIPVGPMLAKPTKGVSEIVEKFQNMEFTCEYKYDGERAQIHYMENGSVEIYSRNAERNTGKFPDVVATITSSEGLIIKTLNKDATYEPAKRSNNWLKLKKDYMESNKQFENLLFALLGTGFSEAMLEERSASLRSKVIPKPKSYYRYSDTISPDVWFEPTEVWEVKAADLTISPVHRAAIGIVDSDKGISLRFPRLLRVREDKNPEQASSSDMVADMYNAQKHNQKDNQDDNEDD